jgi:hypothetical protein
LSFGKFCLHAIPSNNFLTHSLLKIFLQVVIVSKIICLVQKFVPQNQLHCITRPDKTFQIDILESSI